MFVFERVPRLHAANAGKATGSTRPTEEGRFWNYQGCGGPLANSEAASGSEARD
jgi:hypothetical protein